MNPITCADVHFEDGTVQHMEWHELAAAVSQQSIGTRKEEPVQGNWSVYCYWERGKQNNGPHVDWMLVSNKDSEEFAKTFAARLNGEHPEHFYQAFPPAVYPWD